MTTLAKIEQLLGIKLEEKRFGKEYDPDQKNTYSGTEEHIYRLRLDEVVIEDLSALFEFTGELSNLMLVNSTIPNFPDLLPFNTYDLTLDRVTIKDTICTTRGKLPTHTKLYNMRVDAKGFNCFEKSNIGGFRQVEFIHCHIDNIQYLSSIQQVSFLILNTITFTYGPLQHATKSSIFRMRVSNSKLEDVSFLPFKEDLSNIEFDNCKIGSLTGLEAFPELEEISMGTNTRVKDKAILENPHGRNITCSIYKQKKPFDLEHVLPLKKYITSLDLDNFKGDVLPHLNRFKRLTYLNFSGGKVDLEAFLPIASRIQSISFRRSNFYNHECLDQFKSLTSFKLTNFSKVKGLRSFERILPLKGQLEELEIYDVKRIKAVQVLKQFKALKSLKLDGNSIKDVRLILQLQQLKKLSLYAPYKKKRVLNLKQLTNLEYLILDTKLRFKGLGKLQGLKSLQLGSDFSETVMDINSLPNLEQLERLNITNYNQEIKHLSQFPNLKYLRIKGCKKLELKTMKKLEVLDLDNSSINDFEDMEQQPRLKKLNLSSLNTDINLREIVKFPNLSVLVLMETNVSDISDLKSLKKLEYLDLYYTSVSDVRVINTLPKMKEVNLATNSNVDLESQLDRPEIAVYVGRPILYLSVWEEDEFGI